MRTDDTFVGVAGFTGMKLSIIATFFTRLELYVVFLTTPCNQDDPEFHLWADAPLPSCAFRQDTR